MGAITDRYKTLNQISSVVSRSLDLQETYAVPWNGSYEQPIWKPAASISVTRRPSGW